MPPLRYTARIVSRNPKSYVHVNDIPEFDATPSEYTVPSTSPQSQADGLHAPKACTTNSSVVAERINLTIPPVDLSVASQVPTRGDGSIGRTCTSPTG